MSQRPSQPTVLKPVEVVFKHAKHGTFSIFRVEFPIKSTIRQLKQDMAQRFKTPAENQEWRYKNKIIDDGVVLENMGMELDDKIFIKEINEQPQMSREESRPDEAAAYTLN